MAKQLEGIRIADKLKLTETGRFRPPPFSTRNLLHRLQPSGHTMLVEFEDSTGRSRTETYLVFGQCW
jgi:hypothetical protein